MISRILGGAMPWLLAALIALLVFQFQQAQRVAVERDMAVLQVEHEQGRADVLQQHQRWQRQQIRTLNESLAERDRTLARIANDISASTAALERLGETDADSRDWLGGWVPGGIDDWVRQLQRPGDADGVPVPGGTGASNQ